MLEDTSIASIVEEISQAFARLTNSSMIAFYFVHEKNMLHKDGHISKMYFSHWELPGVCERRWSVNLEASISGENQTLGRLAGRPSKDLGSLMTGTAASWEQWSYVWEHLGQSPNQCGNPKLTLRDAWVLSIFIRKTTGVIWDSPNVPQAIRIPCTYNA